MRPIFFTAILFTFCSCAFAQDKPKVFVTNSDSWAAAGSLYGANGVASGMMAGGSSPQTVEVIDRFSKECPAVTVTNNKENASFIIVFDRDVAAARRNKIAVFKKNGDLLYSGKTHAVANAVKDACAAIGKT
jgi:hypothetical protein